MKYKIHFHVRELGRELGREREEKKDKRLLIISWVVIAVYICALYLFLT
jgi:hypothetical protein